jgi:hypothetical protein
VFSIIKNSILIECHDSDDTDIRSELEALLSTRCKITAEHLIEYLGLEMTVEKYEATRVFKDIIKEIESND